VCLLIHVCLTLQLADQESGPHLRGTTGSAEALVELYTGDSSVPPALTPRSPTKPIQGSGSGSGSGSRSRLRSRSGLGNGDVAKSLSLIYSISHSFEGAGNTNRATTSADPLAAKNGAGFCLSAGPFVSAHTRAHSHTHTRTHAHTHTHTHTHHFCH
jgi:hypothetical protein